MSHRHAPCLTGAGKAKSDGDQPGIKSREHVFFFSCSTWNGRGGRRGRFGGRGWQAAQESVTPGSAPIGVLSQRRGNPRLQATPATVQSVGLRGRHDGGPRLRVRLRPRTFANHTAPSGDTSSGLTRARGIHVLMIIIRFSHSQHASKGALCRTGWAQWKRRAFQLVRPAHFDPAACLVRARLAQPPVSPRDALSSQSPFTCTHSARAPPGSNCPAAGSPAACPHGYVSVPPPPQAAQLGVLGSVHPQCEAEPTLSLKTDHRERAVGVMPFSVSKLCSPN